MLVSDELSKIIAQKISNKSRGIGKEEIIITYSQIIQYEIKFTTTLHNLAS